MEKHKVSSTFLVVVGFFHLIIEFIFKQLIDIFNKIFDLRLKTDVYGLRQEENI